MVNVPSTRASPAATVASEAGFPTRICVHIYRKPARSPYASRRNAYSPPYRGRAAAISAYVIAPNSDSRPPTTHTAYTPAELPTAAIISRGTRKIPLPMMIPTTMDVACDTFRTRGSSCWLGIAVWGMD